MEAHHNTDKQVNWRRIGFTSWISLGLLFVGICISPVGMGIIRALTLAAWAGWWLGIPILFWQRKKSVVLPWSIITGLCLLLLSFPAREWTSEVKTSFQKYYLEDLQSYLGTTYVWGGENSLGIDCSGLVRKAFITAKVKLAFSNARFTQLRSAFFLWWYDASAKALMQSYRGWTRVLFKAKSINSLKHTRLQPGDLAVTSDGVHIMAYLGKHRWIEADPDLKKVVIVKTPDRNNMWFERAVIIIRWQELK